MHRDTLRQLACAMSIGVALLALLSPGSRFAFAEDGPLVDQRFEDPLATFRHQRDGLEQILAHMRASPDLYPAEKLSEPRLLSRDERKAVTRTWGAIADHLLALEAQVTATEDFYTRSGDARGRAFHLHRASMFAAYRFAMEIIDQIERDPGLGKLLDEALPEVGLPVGSYSRFKFHYLNVAIATRFAALELLAATASSEPDPALAEASDADRDRIWAMGAGRGPILTAANALQVVGDVGFETWFPFQKGVANWMGNVRVWRPGESLIGQAQIRELPQELEPGDILLERREWFLTNLGIPGFWPHAALYIGTPEERASYFDGPEVAAWLEREGAENLDALLAARHPEAYARSLEPESGHAVRVIESIAAGVVFTSLEHSAAADSIAALRPRLDKREKAMAILHAFGYAGRPYDYDFDFGTDAALVCTELIYKAYQPGEGFKGLALPLESMAGRLVMPANQLAVLYADELGHPEQQLEFVLMLDGDEASRSATRATRATFAESWKRPKWHIITSGSD